MSPLWTSLAKRPEAYLTIVLVVLSLLIADSLRAPNNQISASCWIDAVHVYQRVGRPITGKFIQCRYRPTCSEYSKEAVARYGFPRGILMTIRRLESCRAKVPPGTLDPVP